MQQTGYEILVWLPSPLGDAVLCTPALRAIRQHFKSSQITFFGNPVVRGILSPSSFNDRWLELDTNNPFAIAKMLRAHKFTHSILFKNSFASAIAVFFAGIPLRIGYARDGRGFLLTEKLYPPKLPDGRFKPVSMVDYYLAIAARLGADNTDKNLELSIQRQDRENIKAKLPQVAQSRGPVVIIVPGASGGPSKCWLSERFAQTADWLIGNYNATVVVSVAPSSFERQIAEKICDSRRRSLQTRQGNHKNNLVNLAENPVSLGELKALFADADLVISNDTGPRHIAVALRRKIISLLGPNHPAWTDLGYEDEIRIIGSAPCAPCERPVCRKSEHLCMQAITVEMVCDAAKKLLGDSNPKS
jgi:heptosyltransferase-2